jgi:hypothetical protein
MSGEKGEVSNSYSTLRDSPFIVRAIMNALSNLRISTPHHRLSAAHYAPKRKHCAARSQCATVIAALFRCKTR